MSGAGQARAFARSGLPPHLPEVAAMALVWVAIVAIAEPYAAGSFGSAHDAHDYWDAAHAADPYARAFAWGSPGVYVYSPAFLQFAAPLLNLPWQAFVAVWTGLALAALAWMTRPGAVIPLLLLALPEVWGGNIHLLLGAAIVLGFRYPAVWAFVLLTKVTPGIGVLWFAARREWRKLAIALGATGFVVALSYLTAPDLWPRWLDALAGNAGADPVVLGVIPVPLVLRLPVAIGLIAWGAPRDQRWTLPVACMLALPAWWIGGLAMLLAIPALIDWKLPPGTSPRLRGVARLAGIEPAT